MKVTANALLIIALVATLSHSTSAAAAIGTITCTQSFTTNIQSVECAEYQLALLILQQNLPVELQGFTAAGTCGGSSYSLSVTGLVILPDPSCNTAPTDACASFSPALNALFSETPSGAIQQQCSTSTPPAGSCTCTCTSVPSGSLCVAAVGACVSRGGTSGSCGSTTSFTCSNVPYINATDANVQCQSTCAQGGCTGAFAAAAASNCFAGSSTVQLEVCLILGPLFEYLIQ